MLEERVIAPASPYTKVTVLHVEDEEDWVRIVSDLVRRLLPDVEYRHVRGGVAEGVREALLAEQLPILIADLRCADDYQSQLESIRVLLDDRASLLSRNIPVAVLSGYVSREASYLFRQKGIQIFGKSSFSQAELVDFLRREIQRMKSISSGSVSLDSVYELEAYIVDPRALREAERLQRGRRYSLVIRIEAQGNLVDYREFIACGIIVYVYSSDVKLSSPAKVISLPEEGGLARSMYELYVPENAPSQCKLSIFSFYRNRSVGFAEIFATIE